ncbi:hypothetical protein [Metabacillus halosaccharovorans]|uniref:hypothetical protein n=1 Tax=Metabacillus halosaccharovorans TaxID=930124 RepID=UPI0009949EE3|nr:hypothetical protein [Metabacillus halosaccharovorans]
MKKITLLPAIILFSVGIFYSIQKLNIHLFEGQSSWEVLLILLGFAFLISGHFEQDSSAILPGVILAGVGIHFFFYEKVPSWPAHSASFLFIISVGLILTAIKTKSGYLQGVILLAIGLFLHFFPAIMGSLSIVENGVNSIETYWPFLFVVIGGVLLVVIRKK